MFTQMKNHVQHIFKSFDETSLFKVDLEKDVLYTAYLDAFPLDERQHHTCNCCRAFINNYGTIVEIKNNKIKTLWDFKMDAPYDKIPQVLHDLVSNAVIKNRFISDTKKLGVDSNKQRLEDGTIITWDHFYVPLKTSACVVAAKQIDTILGNNATTKQMFERALTSISLDAAQTVLELIAQNSLYRGAEFREIVKTFVKQKKAYDKLSTIEQDRFVWLNCKDGGRIRNTSIGTLLVDLTEGRALDDAVRAFETIVAPANYKRTTSLVTPKMIELAEQKINDLGLGDALSRRHAIASDISVSDLLFVNRDTKGSVFDEMKADVPVNMKSFSKVEEVPVETFIKEILPLSEKVEVLLENRLKDKFMSLIAPVNPDAANMFKWSNNISWAYSNNLTDSIKEKVKEAGGTVEGALRISLEWFNYDDLDLHVIEPDGNRISFNKKVSPHGFLDVDMNAGAGKTREAVENVIFKSNTKILEGEYKVIVHNFNKRENIDLGFNIEIEAMGTVINLQYNKAVANNQYKDVATFNYNKKTGITDFKSQVPEVSNSKKVNEVETNKFQKVKMICNSPNYFGENKIGNEHLFFIVEGAKIDTPINGFFNEFLRNDLTEHRKVFEVLGNKLKIQPADEQLTGIGFSLTQRDSLICKVTGKSTRTIKVII